MQLRDIVRKNEDVEYEQGTSASFGRGRTTQRNSSYVQQLIKKAKEILVPNLRHIEEKIYITKFNLAHISGKKAYLEI